MTTIVRKEGPRNPVIREQVLARAAMFAKLGGESVVLFGGVASEECPPKLRQQYPLVRVECVAATGLHAFVRAVRRAGRESDVLICRGPTPTMAALIARRTIANAPRIVYDARGWFFGEAYDKGRRGPSLYARGAIERLAFRFADRVVAPSQALLGVAVASGASPERVALIPQVTEPGRGSQKRTIDVVYVGNSRLPYQPHEAIGELLRGLAEAMPDLVFEWLDGEAGEAREQISENLVRYSLEPEQVPARLAQARVGLVIRKPSRTNIAAAPTKAAQYLAAGCCIVTEESPPAVAEWALMGGGALVADGGTLESWATAIRKALSMMPMQAPEGDVLASLWRRVLAV